MPIGTTNAISGPYYGNGVATAFPFTFEVISADQVEAHVNGIAASPATYSVSLTGPSPSTGTVTFYSAPADGDVIYTVLSPSFTQDIEFADGAPYLAKPVNDGYDQSALRDQALARDIGRGFMVPLGESGITLPTAAARSGKYFAFDAQGAVVLLPGTSPSPAQASMVAMSGGDSVDSAVEAQRFPTVAAMLASGIPARGAGRVWRASSFSYVEASASSADYHLITAGGVKLYAIPVGGVLSVEAFNAPKDGVTDSYPAFLGAYNASPVGSRIVVPYAPLGYYLSANPDDRSKSVTWELEANTALSGPGMGDPSSGAGTFGSLYTNPWLRVLGSHRTLGFGTVDSPAGGAIIGDSLEFKPDPLTGWPVNFTGTVTNGSATITGISPSQIARVYKGCRITSPVSQWGWNGTQTVNLRVLSVDHQAGSITVGQDVYGNWVNAPFLFLGTTTTGASFTVHKRQWFAGRYEGLDTGTQDASIPGELHYEICNPVMNITGAPGAMYEFNLNVYADTSDYCRALFITGSGDAHNDKLIGIDLQRGGKSPWATAVSIRNATVGLFTNAQFPIQIDTEYTNIRTGNIDKIGYGIHFNNILGLKGALLEGAQLTNAGDAIWLQRATDTSPSGTFMNLFAADGVARLGYWSTSGEIHASGVHVLDGFDLNLGSTYTAGAPAATGYTTIKIRGISYKVLISS